MPELEQIAEGHGGLGGSDSKKGWVDLSTYRSSNLQLKTDIGVYDTSDALSPLIDDFGFISDTLIGHNYLKQYKWVLDFDTMKQFPS